MLGKSIVFEKVGHGEFRGRQRQYFYIFGGEGNGVKFSLEALNV